jgi:hypothetical protein
VNVVDVFTYLYVSRTMRDVEIILSGGKGDEGK